MKPVGKPGSAPVVSVPRKNAEVGTRPGFPLRLRADEGLPPAAKTAAKTAAKKIADSARKTSTTGLFPSKYATQNLPGPAARPAVKTPAQLLAPAGMGMVSEAIRARMVQKLAASGISDAQVLAAMGRIERHCFVDSALANQAYEDTSLPIGLGQTISKPSVVARMLELLMRGSTGRLAGRVLEIGTGCGYQSAVLGQLATEVYSMERLRGLHEKARDNLRPYRLANVHLIFGDGMVGHAGGAPYAAIIAAAGGEAIPQAWIEQLAVGGRLVAPMQGQSGVQAGGAGGQTGQVLVVVDKTPQGIRQTLLEAVHFVPLKSGTS